MTYVRFWWSWFNNYIFNKKVCNPIISNPSPLDIFSNCIKEQFTHKEGCMYVCLTFEVLYSCFGYLKNLSMGFKQD